MFFSDFNNPPWEHAVTLSFDSKEPCLLKRDGPCSTRSGVRELNRKGNNIVYFMFSDDKLMKVGGSSTGIGKLLASYILNLEGRADPMFTRFPIYLDMLRETYSGKKIHIYFLAVEPYEIIRPCLISGKMSSITVDDFHPLELSYVRQVEELDGKVPEWNIAEASGKSFNSFYKQLWKNRKDGLKEHKESNFNYQMFLDDISKIK